MGVLRHVGIVYPFSPGHDGDGKKRKKKRQKIENSDTFTFEWRFYALGIYVPSSGREHNYTVI